MRNKTSTDLKNTNGNECWDYVIIGSGFGGSVSAMRLIEKGYKVLVLERGRRYEDQDFAKTDWNLAKLFWLPALRSFGIWEWTLFNGGMVQTGSGVGGGSLVYSNVLMEPDDVFFESSDWNQYGDWKTILAPHYETAKQMLGVTTNPKLLFADDILKEIAADLGVENSFAPTQVGVCFSKNGNEGDLIPDPYFNGEGPARNGCTFCGGCITGCRENAKNTMVKNYLYLAEKYGAEVQPETTVKVIKPLLHDQDDGARYELASFCTTSWRKNENQTIRAKRVIVAAGGLGTLKLLLKCRDKYRSLPNLSSELGKKVRTNGEELTTVINPSFAINQSEGISISSIIQPDAITHIEPVRLPAGSSFLGKLLITPLLSSNGSQLKKAFEALFEIIRHPVQFWHYKIRPKLGERSTIFLIMQTDKSSMRVKLGRNIFTLFRRGLVAEMDEENPVKATVDMGHKVTRMFGEKTGGMPLGVINDSVLDIPSTAHFMGGVPFGSSAENGVIDLNCEVFNYPGLYVVDGSIIPGNPGINPSLTIAALAEYAMEKVPAMQKDSGQDSMPPAQPVIIE